MTQQLNVELLTKPIFAQLRETFESGDGIYLDRGTSLFETLDTFSAKTASRTTIPGGTSIAGHTDHVRFYLRVLNDYIDGRKQEKIDWKESWLRHTVSDAEWRELRAAVRDDYTRFVAHLKSIDDWNDERRLSGAWAVVVHTAFHLGAIRQIMKVVATQSEEHS